MACLPPAWLSVRGRQTPLVDCHLQPSLVLAYSTPLKFSALLTVSGLERRGGILILGMQFPVPFGSPAENKGR